MVNYLKSFLIGCSLMTVWPFYITARLAKAKKYKYENYILIAPLYFGILNILSLYLSTKYNWSLEKRLFYVSIFSPILVITISKLFGAYHFTTNKQWTNYMVRIIIMHMLTYNTSIYLLEKYL